MWYGAVIAVDDMLLCMAYSIRVHTQCIVWYEDTIIR